MSENTTEDFLDEDFLDDSQFPRDVFTLKQLRSGAILLHILGIFYAILGIALVSKEYLVPSLAVLIEKLGISRKSIGATVVIIGLLLPSLITSIIGTFVSFNAVSIGGLVGSSVFNVTVLLGICACAITQPPLQLKWIPICRDFGFYLGSLILICLFFMDNKMVWYENLVLILMFGVYILVMIFYGKKVENSPIAEQVEMKQENGENGPNSEDNISIGEPIELFWPRSCGKKVLYIIAMPILLPIWLILPDVKNPEKSKFFILTYLGSIIFLGIFSYLLVWWTTVVGGTFGIPPVLLGFTVLAIGMIFPSLYTLLFFGRNKLGSSFVAALFGLNIFDITIA